MARLRLFYSPGACSLASHIALEEAGADFEPVLTDTRTGAHLTPDYLRLNPKGRVPTLLVDDWALTENPAILQFVAASHPEARLWPADTHDAARVAEWLAWLSSTVHVAFAHVRRAERYAATEAGKEDVRHKGREVARVLWRDVEARLAAPGWAVGEHRTVADCYLMVFWNWGEALGFDMPRDCPHWTRHARAMAERFAVRRAYRREGLPLPS